MCYSILQQLHPQQNLTLNRNLSLPSTFICDLDEFPTVDLWMESRWSPVVSVRCEVQPVHK